MHAHIDTQKQIIRTYMYNSYTTQQGDRDARAQSTGKKSAAPHTSTADEKASISDGPGGGSHPAGHDKARSNNSDGKQGGGGSSSVHQGGSSAVSKGGSCTSTTATTIEREPHSNVKSDGNGQNGQNIKGAVGRTSSAGSDHHHRGNNDSNNNGNNEQHLSSSNVHNANNNNKKDLSLSPRVDRKSPHNAADSHNNNNNNGANNPAPPATPVPKSPAQMHASGSPREASPLSNNNGTATNKNGHDSANHSKHGDNIENKNPKNHSKHGSESPDKYDHKSDTATPGDVLVADISGSGGSYGKPLPDPHARAVPPIYPSKNEPATALRDPNKPDNALDGSGELSPRKSPGCAQCVPKCVVM
jgi:hypothetical protein